MNLKTIGALLILLIVLQIGSPAWSWERPGAPPFNTTQRTVARPISYPLTVHLLNKTSTSGRLIHATDNELILWIHGSDYDPDHIAAGVKKIQFSHVNSITINLDKDVLTGARYGFLTGALIGAVFATPSNSFFTTEFVKIVSGITLGLIGAVVGGVFFAPDVTKVIPVRNEPNIAAIRQQLNKTALFPDALPQELQTIVKPVRPLGPRLD